MRTGGGWIFLAVFSVLFEVLGLRVTVLGALLLGVLSLADVLALALGFLNSFLICLWLCSSRNPSVFILSCCSKICSGRTLTKLSSLVLLANRAVAREIALMLGFHNVSVTGRFSFASTACTSPTFGCWPSANSTIPGAWVVLRGHI